MDGLCAFLFSGKLWAIGMACVCDAGGGLISQGDSEPVIESKVCTRLGAGSSLRNGAACAIRMYSSLSTVTDLTLPKSEASTTILKLVNESSSCAAHRCLRSVA